MIEESMKSLGKIGSLRAFLCPMVEDEDNGKSTTWCLNSEHEVTGEREREIALQIRKRKIYFQFFEEEC
jgi:hypothetical protein